MKTSPHLEVGGQAPSQSLAAKATARKTVPPPPATPPSQGVCCLGESNRRRAAAPRLAPPLLRQCSAVAAELVKLMDDDERLVEFEAVGQGGLPTWGVRHRGWQQEWWLGKGGGLCSCIIHIFIIKYENYYIVIWHFLHNDGQGNGHQGHFF